MYPFIEGCILEANLEGQGVNRKRGESFGSSSAREGANDLPWRRKDLPGGPEVGGNYTD